eukprot:UN15712
MRELLLVWIILGIFLHCIFGWSLIWNPFILYPSFMTSMFVSLLLFVSIVHVAYFMMFMVSSMMFMMSILFHMLDGFFCHLSWECDFLAIDYCWDQFE